jgi:F0F1-type ATP synthase membrane subunit c/vacuolar-type H+-ATPase subunit K
MGVPVFIFMIFYARIVLYGFVCALYIWHDLP